MSFTINRYFQVFYSILYSNQKYEAPLCELVEMTEFYKEKAFFFYIFIYEKYFTPSSSINLILFTSTCLYIFS